MKIVPNQFPEDKSPLSIAVIGEAPGELEEGYGKPFIGPSGKLLTALLIQAGAGRDKVFLGNVCQIRPPLNDATKITADQLREGKIALKADLQTFNPNVCLLLGNTPLLAAGVTHGVSAYRGTVFMCNDLDSPFYGRKCIASYHPSYVLRGNNKDSVILFADIKKAIQEASVVGVQSSERNYELHLSADEIIQRLEEIESLGCEVSFDIEGGVNGVTCCSVSTDPSSAFIIPFFFGKRVFWDLHTETRIWKALSKMLQNPRVPKVLQNSLYDRFVLAWTNSILITNVKNDTMLKHWELFPEMEKGLGFQTSYYTKEPYYKSERVTIDAEQYHAYCCKDSAITLEICNKQSMLMAGRPLSCLAHYNFNVNMLNPLLYMELRGIRYDSEKAKTKIAGIQSEIDVLQNEVDTFNGGPLNVSSSKQMLAFLEKLKLEVPVNRKTGRPTANYEAILSLAKKTGMPVLTKIMALKERRTRVQMLNIRADHDGRIRCGYNIVGTETGRLTCYTSPTGSGYNLQTIPSYDRDLFLSDKDKYFFQCDLSGADAWTVAAWCAKLGDRTMLDDMLSGIKVAKVIASMFLDGPEIAGLDRLTLKSYANKISKEDPIYFGSKCVQHGSNYGMGKILMSATIFIQSEGKVNLAARDCQKLQDLYFKRYPGVKRWHTFVQSRLAHTGSFTSASGHIRTFSGNRTAHDTFKQALANEPQENTTYATNLAAYNLWNDPENRNTDGSLIIEPLHQVHDALCGQFPIDRTEWAVQKIRSYFNNTLVIADELIKIPFEGGYGSSWGELNQGNI
jgi:DNA polymerase